MFRNVRGMERNQKDRKKALATAMLERDAYPWDVLYSLLFATLA